MDPRRRAPRIVLTTTGTLGDFLPLVAIAVALRARGLDPLLASMEEYRPAAEAEGLAFHAVRPGHAEMTAQGLDHCRVARAVMHDLRAGFTFMLPHLPLTLEDLRGAFAGADLVVAGTLAVAARALAESMRIPVVTVILQPMGFLSAAEPPAMREMPLLPWLRRRCGPGFIRMLYAIAAARGRKQLGPLADLRRSLDLPVVRDELIDGPRRSERIFAMYPRAYAQPPSDAPQQTQSAGFPGYDGRVRQPLDVRLQAFLRAGPAPLVFTLGSFVTHAPGDFYEVSAAAARTLGRRAVLLVGGHAEAQFAHLAGDDVAVVGFAQHSALFHHAAAVIHHGGIGTTSQALLAGVPQLVCPFFGDQLDNAKHLERLGVGETLSLRRYTRKNALKALHALLDNPVVARTARRLAPQMAKQNGPAIVAAWIERRLRPGARHLAEPDQRATSRRRPASTAMRRVARGPWRR